MCVSGTKISAIVSFINVLEILSQILITPTMHGQHLYESHGMARHGMEWQPWHGMAWQIRLMKCVEHKRHGGCYGFTTTKV